jgi:hypothetical protein
MTVSINIHPNAWPIPKLTLRASTYADMADSAPLMIKVVETNRIIGEVTIFTYDAALTAALVDAINNAAGVPPAEAPIVPTAFEGEAA